MFRLLHLSDPHLTTPTDWREAQSGSAVTRLQQLKRQLAFGAWRRRRRHIHRPEVLAEVAAHIRDRARPDHIVVTGDLTQLGLPTELAAAATWLRTIGAGSNVSVVPGNHDIYAADSRAALDSWRPFMSSDDSFEPTSPHHATADWPFVRHRGAVTIIGLNSGAPTPVLSATGVVPEQELAALPAVLASNAQRFRVLLVHHSPSATAHPWRKRLQQGAELLAAIAASAHPPHLVLHGHGHGATHEWLRIGTHDPIPIVQATAASAKQPDPRRAGGYNEFAITASATTSPERWRVRMVKWHWTDQGMIASTEQTWAQGA